MGYGVGGGFLISGSNDSAFFLDVTYHTIMFDDGDTSFLAYSVGGVFRFDLNS